jgi:hypothetical protein
VTGIYKLEGILGGLGSHLRFERRLPHPSPQIGRPEVPRRSGIWDPREFQGWKHRWIESEAEVKLCGQMTRVECGMREQGGGKVAVAQSDGTLAAKRAPPLSAVLNSKQGHVSTRRYLCQPPFTICQRNIALKSGPLADECVASSGPTQLRLEIAYARGSEHWHHGAASSLGFSLTRAQNLSSITDICTLVA